MTGRQDVGHCRICELPEANEASTKSVREQKVGFEQGARTEERS